MLWIDFKLGPRGGARRTVTLDGRVWLLDVLWMPSDTVWSLTILDAKGVVLRAGRWLRHGENALEGTGCAKLPCGRLVPWDTANRQRDPGRDDLRRGSAVRLVYIPEGE